MDNSVAIAAAQIATWLSYLVSVAGLCCLCLILRAALARSSQHANPTAVHPAGEASDTGVSLGAPERRASKEAGEERARVGRLLRESVFAVAAVSLSVVVLLPILHTALEHKNQTTCIANLHDIGVAWTQYTEDYDDTNVIGNYSSAGAREHHYWFGSVDATGRLNKDTGLLAPYMRADHRIQNCPSADLHPAIQGPSFGYGVNEALYPEYQVGDKITSVSVSKISAPSDTVLISDSASMDNVVGPELGTALTLFMPSDAANPYPTSHARHFRHANILWYDGHAGAQRLGPPTTSDSFGNKPSVIASYDLGYITKPGCVVGDEGCQDYYYSLEKPF